MPALDGVDDNAETGYHRLLRKSFVTLLERQKATLPAGGKQLACPAVET